MAYVVSANLHRRHLTENQRIALAVELLPVFEDEAKSRQVATLKRGDEAPAPVDANWHERGGKSVERAAAVTKTKPRSVARGKAVKESGVPELFAMVKSGEVAVSAAAEVATLPEDEQREVVAGGKKAIQAKAKAIRDAKPKRPGKGGGGKGAPPTPTVAAVPPAADSIDQAAAEMLNVGRGTVEAASKVLRHGAQELVSAVERGDVAVSAAAVLVSLPEDEQREVVAAGPDAIKAKVKASCQCAQVPPPMPGVTMISCDSATLEFSAI